MQEGQVSLMRLASVALISLTFRLRFAHSQRLLLEPEVHR